MTKILIATGVYPPESGGPATYSKLVEERLPAHGFVVRVLPFRTVRQLPKIVRHVAYFFKLLFMRADIVYALDTVSVGLPAALAATLTGRTFVVRVPGDYAWEQGRQRFGVQDELDQFQTKRYGMRVGLLRAVQRFVVRRATAVVVPSEYMRRVVSGWCGAKKVHRIYSSIALPPKVEPLHERPSGFLVVSFGRRVPWKGFEALERVVAQESRWTLQIFSELPHAQAMGWLAAANVYVNNSSYEGLSHQLVEAFALGTPVVATNVGGNPELVEHEVTGLLVPQGDEVALRAALQRVALDPAGANTRAQAAKNKVQQFSIDTAVGELAALLKKL